MRLKDKVIKKIKQDLLKRRERQQMILESLKSQDPFSNPERLIDNAPDTDAKEESSHDRVEAMEEELKKSIAEIDGVLEIISKGKYGKCSACKKQIDPKRLMVKPTASFCINCLEKEKRL